MARAHAGGTRKSVDGAFSSRTPASPHPARLIRDLSTVISRAIRARRAMLNSREQFAVRPRAGQLDELWSQVRPSEPPSALHLLSSPASRCWVAESGFSGAPSPSWPTIPYSTGAKWGSPHRHTDWQRKASTETTSSRNSIEPSCEIKISSATSHPSMHVARPTRQD